MLAVPSDNLPANSVAIAAGIGIGIDQESDDRVDAKSLEEIPPSAGAKCTAARLGILVEGVQDFVLLLRSGGGKFLHAREDLLDPGL